MRTTALPLKKYTHTKQTNKINKQNKTKQEQSKQNSHVKDRHKQCNR